MLLLLLPLTTAKEGESQREIGRSRDREERGRRGGEYRGEAASSPA